MKQLEPVLDRHRGQSGDRTLYIGRSGAERQAPESTARRKAFLVSLYSGPVLRVVSSYLGTETTPRVGGQHTLNAEYFRRIDALNYTLMHDDGQHTANLDEADVVLVGISRTSKTPTDLSREPRH